MIEKLRLYNQWRRGADIPQPDPTEIGELLDTVADRLEVLEREAAKHYERWHQERRRREFLELRLEELAGAFASRREIMAENGARELPEG